MLNHHGCKGAAVNLIPDFMLREKNSAWSVEWGTGTWVKMSRFKAFSRNVKTLNLIFFSHTGRSVQAMENSASILGRDKALRGLRKYQKIYPWG